MSNVFRHVKPTRLKRNPFNLSFENNLTTEFGRLTPFLCQEVVAGDSFRIGLQTLIRMAPLFAPAFSRVNCYVHYYFVSHRLLFDKFETFITGGENGDGIDKTRAGVDIKAERCYLDVLNTASAFREYFSSMGYENPMEQLAKYFQKGSLFDYLGFPTYDVNEEIGWDDFYNFFTEPIDLTPFIAYQFIYNEYFRDQNFQDEIDLVTDARGNIYDYLMSTLRDPFKSIEIILNLLRLRIRNWEKDYFTSALPFPQRGEDTTIGENDTAVYNTQEQYRAPIQGDYADVDMQAIATRLKVSGNIVASVNEFRRAMAVQRFREAMARYGARYTEFLRGIFGTAPTDARLQRPEFLGGGKIPIQFGEVLQTSQTDLTPQGSYAGRGIAGGSLPRIKARFDEPGWIIGILSIMPKPFYMQGWPRKFSRFDRFDWFIPQFANIGEQEILQKEVCFDYNIEGDILSDDINNKLFGYIPRYSEMRYNPNEIHGDFRNTLQDWHTARILEPVRDVQRSMLNGNFIQVDRDSSNRIFNYRAGDYDHFWLDIYNDIQALRPLPKYGTPMI